MLAPFRIRESPRARQVRLVLSLRDGLTVVIPVGFDRDRIPAIVAGKQRWLERARQRLARQPAPAPPAAPARPPERIPLPGINEEWSVEYQATAARSITLIPSDGCRLLLRGAVEHHAVVFGLLRHWLRRKAEKNLVARLRELAAARGFTFNRVLIRTQRSRWGSCSSRGTISLNQKLLFLPQELVDYVILHELVHTRCPNHSPEFWRQVALQVPDVAQRRREMRRAERQVPSWAG